MPSTFALTLAKWTLDVATRLVKANVRLHHAEVLENDMAAVLVVNHFTRLETMLLPYILYKHTGKEIWSLAASELFQGRIGEFLQSTGTISTKAPDRDKVIVRSLLQGANPWIIFPEGAMVKDKKVIDRRGEFQVYSNGQRRPPHKGAAVLALRAEFYRHKLRCLHDRPGQAGLAEALALFDLESAEELLARRTVIIPVNITYFPIRAKENVFLRIAQQLSGDLSKRAIEELSVEGTVLAEDTVIDIVLGEPIDVREYLDAPEYAKLMACGLHDMQDLEMNPASLFNEAARRLMARYMRDIYQLTTVNFDHLAASLLRLQRSGAFSRRAFRQRMFMCARALENHNCQRHPSLANSYRDLIYDEPNPRLEDFLGLCLKEGALRREGPHYRRTLRPPREQWDFHTARAEELTEVIANEAEPIDGLSDLIRRTSRLPQFLLAWRIREMLMREELQLFEADYARYYDPQYSKGPEIARPFLLQPLRPKGGIVLSHGYMAAPLEIHALADYFYRHGYAVYGVRLRGHGTSPEDLSQTPWQEWYESFNRGYAILSTITNVLFAGGFSTGGCLALMAAAHKGHALQGAFSICAPLKLQNYSVRLAPSLVTLNALLKRMGRKSTDWDYVGNDPENKHINYTRNPLTGVKELVSIMDAMEEELPRVRIPVLVAQASKDPTVNPASAPLIFEKLGCKQKEMIIFERDRHGIINGEGSEDVFHRVLQFLERLPKHARSTKQNSQIA